MKQQSRHPQRANFAQAKRNKELRDLQRNAVLDQMSIDLAHALTMNSGGGINVVETQADADRVNQRTRQEMMSRGALSGHVVHLRSLKPINPNSHSKDYQFSPYQYIHIKEDIDGFQENDLVMAMDYRKRSEPTKQLMVQCKDGSRKLLPQLQAHQYDLYQDHDLPLAKGEQLRVIRETIISEQESGRFQSFSIHDMELDGPDAEDDPCFEYYYSNLYHLEKNQICNVDYLGHCNAALHLNQGEKVPSDFEGFGYGYAVTPDQMPSNNILFINVHGEKLLQDSRVRTYIDKNTVMGVTAYDEYGRVCDKYGRKTKEYHWNKDSLSIPNMPKARQRAKEIDMEM